MAANAPNLINVVNPNGELVAIDAAQARDAVNYGGYRVPSADELAGFARQEKYGSGLNPLITGTESAASALTLGASRQFENMAGLTTPEDQAGRAEENPTARGVGTGVGLAAPILASFVAGPEVGAGAVAADAGETASLLGTGAKALTSSALPLNAVTRTGRAISDALVPAGVENLGSVGQFLAKAPAHALGSAVEGAAFGLGSSVDESALGDPDALGEKLLPNMLGGAGIGALIGGGAMGVGAGLKGVGQMLPEAKNLGVKLLSTFGGMSEKDILGYMADREAVNGAPEFEDVYQHSLGHVQELADQVASKQMTADQAREALGAKAAEIKATFSDLGYDARRAKALANDALDRAQEDLATKVQSQALDQAPAVHDAVSGLRQKVFAQSAAAMDELQDGEKLNLSPVFNRVDDEVTRLTKENTDESLAAAKKLEAWKSRTHALYGFEVAPTDAKAMIQGLDKSTEYNFNQTSFDKNANRALKQVRYSIDDELKDQFPNYRSAMKPVADDMRLLRSLDDYGTPEDATRRIKQLKAVDKYRTDMPLLKQLEERTGAKFTGAIEPYANPTVSKALHEALPEYGAARKASDAYDALQNPRMKRAMQEIEATPEHAAHQQAQAALEAAQAQAKTLGLTQSNLQGKLSAAMRGKNIEAARLISQLPGMNGKDVPKILEALQLKQAFQKGSMNGSRHVNMYADALGALAGAVTGHFYLGAGAGGAIGGFMDKYGPQVTKKILDAVSDNSMHVGTLTALERAGQKTTRGVLDSAKAVFAGMGSGAALQAAKPRSGSEHNEFADNLRGFISNPENMVNQMDHATRVIYGSAPNTAGAVQQTAIRATQFLASKLPATPPKAPLGPVFEPSRGELAKFNRYAEVVENPLRALEHVRDGTITPETIEALSSVYPKLYQEMKSSVLDQLTGFMSKKEKKQLPRGTRLALSAFLGQDLDGTLSQIAISANQSAMAQPASGDGGPEGGKPTQAGLSKLSANTQMMTPLQSVAQRSQS